MFSRHDFLSQFPIAREADVKGHFHPSELRRKLSRDLVKYGLFVAQDDGGIQKDAIGHATGTATGIVRAGATQWVRPAGQVHYYDRKAHLQLVFLVAVVPSFLGFVLAYASWAWTVLLVMLAVALAILVAVLGKKYFCGASPFDARVQVEAQMQIAGETYEDFRAGSNVPISSNLSLLIGGRVDYYPVTNAKQDELIRAGTARITAFDGVSQEIRFWTAKLQDLVDATVKKAADTVKELEESFAGAQVAAFSGPAVKAPMKPFDAPENLPAPLPEPPEGVVARSVPPALRYKVLERDRFTCRYCGRKAPEVVLEIDHGVSWATGGETNIENLVTACRDCNRGKSAASVDPNVTKPDILREMLGR